MMGRMGSRQISVFEKKFYFSIKQMSTKEQALAIFEKYYKEWESNPERMENGYQYESTYAQMMQKVEQEILQLSVGKVSKSKNTKKTSNAIWENRSWKDSCFK